MSDARFEDGAEAPLYLKAVDAEDLAVISSLGQDSVFPITEMKYQRGKRRFALLINRFRWEDAPLAERGKRAFERVRSVLAVEDVMSVATQGIDRGDREVVLSLLSLKFEPGHDGTGRLTLILAGDGAIALEVECLDVTLKDVTRPHSAVSGKVPGHGEA